MTLLVVSLLAILLLLLISCILLLMVRDALVNKVPFIPVRGGAVSEIVKALQLTPTSTLYDLGCGDGRVLIAALQLRSEIMAVGIENGIIPFLVAKLRTRKHPFKVKFGSFFKADISSATHIFCYLSNPTMKEILPKIQKECAKGTRIVSCAFAFPDWEPRETISLEASKYALAKILYVYEI